MCNHRKAALTEAKTRGENNLGGDFVVGIFPEGEEFLVSGVRPDMVGRTC